MEKRRNQLILSLLIKKTNPYNDENSIGSKWSDLTEEDEEDIALANFIESLHKQTDEKFFLKKVTRWLFDDCGIVPNKNKRRFFWSNF